jgi:hypothetical protein
MDPLREELPCRNIEFVIFVIFIIGGVAKIALNASRVGDTLREGEIFSDVTDPRRASEMGVMKLASSETDVPNLCSEDTDSVRAARLLLSSFTNSAGAKSALKIS